MTIEIPTAASENGNGNGNGNGHKKPFELAPVKTPEQIAAEATRKIAPEIRRGVHFSRLPAPVKFFFDALLDLSFMHCYGGSGRGKIFITERDLSRLLRHDKDSIAKWRDRLIRERLIWIRKGWPKNEWRICALCPAPETEVRFTEYDNIRGRAAALEPVKGTVRDLPPSPFLPKNGQPPSVSEETGGADGKGAASLSDNFRQTVRELPTDCPTSSDTERGRTRTQCPTTSDKVGEDTPPHCPTPSDSQSEGFRANKETTRRVGGTGGSRSVCSPVAKPSPTHTIPEFEPLDWKMIARLRPKHAEMMVERFKGQIQTIEQSRTPVPDGPAIVAAYKAQIKAVRNWAAGVRA